MMKRREVITLLGGMTATWPLAARAQQGERVRRIGMLESLKADDKEAQARISAFAQGLKELGWTEGRNVQIDVLFGPDNADLTQARGGNGRACAGCDPCKWQRDDRALAASDTHSADRVRDRPRSRRRWIRRELGSAGRQCHRLYPLRIRRRREVAGAAQGGHAEHDASGGYSRSSHRVRGSASSQRSRPWRPR